MTTKITIWNKNFILFLLNIAQGTFGAAMCDIALAFLVLKVTGSPAKMAITMALSLLHYSVMPFAATFIDRVYLKPPLIVLSVIQGISLLLMVAFLMHLHVYIFYFFVVLNSMVAAMYDPAIIKMIPALLPKELLERGNGSFTFVHQILGALGLLVGGVLVALIGAANVVILYGALCVSAAIIFMFISMPKLQAHAYTDFKGLGKDVVCGTKMIFTSKILLIIVGLSFLGNTLVDSPMMALLPVYMQKIGKGGAGFGYFLSAVAFGCASSGILVALLGRKINNYKAIGYAVLTGAPVYLSLYFAHTFTALLIFAFALGLSGGFSSTLALVIIQKIAPFTHVGRVMGIADSLANIGGAVSLLVLSFFISRVTISVPFLLGVFVSLIIGLTWLYSCHHYQWQKQE